MSDIQAALNESEIHATDIAISRKNRVAKLSPNSLYLVKIRAVSTNPNGAESSIQFKLGYRSARQKFMAQRVIDFAIPIVSDSEEDYGVQGNWYEQMLFIRTDDITNALIWSHTGKNEATLIVRITTVFVDFAQFPSLERLLSQFANKVAVINGKRYKAFLGIEDAAQFLNGQRQAIAMMGHPELNSDTQGGQEQNSLLVGMVGDELLSGLLNTTITCIKIGPEAIPLIRGNAFDAIVIQTRAVNIAPKEMSSVDESGYLSDLAVALSQTQVPILELKASTSSSAESILRPIRNSNYNVEVTGSEFEFANFAPLRGSSWNARTVAIPCASDLYQHPEFQDLAIRLVNSGFTLAICESNFDHVPIRTWERFQSAQVKVYGRLNVVEQAALFRNSNFVLLPGETLRPISDLSNLAVTALMNGALPIALGGANSTQLSAVAEIIWGYGTLHEYMSRNSSLLTRERHWLSRYRQFMSQLSRGKLRNALSDFAAGRQLIRNNSALPFAEMLCISKRPENIEIILENFRRQSYSNLGMHLIWNVSPDKAQFCLDETKKIGHPNLRVSVIDETHNIGSCLNHGIRNTDADFWFKIDDDDYYGVNYIVDLVNYYQATGCAAAGKPSAFVYFSSSKNLYLRNHSPAQMRRWLEPGSYFCGATLSGRTTATLPMFSTSHRNSCDSHWVENLQASGIEIALSDIFNFCIKRGDPKKHTWQVKEKKLESSSNFLAKNECMEWIDAA